MPRVLVTGASGLLGRRIVPLLREQGVEVLTTSRHDRLHPADLTRPGSMTALMESLAPDAVVHLAGGVPAPAVSTWEINLLPGIELLHAAARCRPQPRIILMGSAAEYGAAGALVTEETPTEPVSDYGRAKQVQTISARKFHEMGAAVLVLRPFNIVAPDLPSSNALGNLRAQVMASRPAPSCTVRCGRLDVVRDFVSADFVAHVVSRCLSAWPKEFLLNVASGTGISLLDIFEAFGVEMAVRLTYATDPTLAAIAAPDVMTADPTALERATGQRFEAGARQLARVLAGSDGIGHEHSVTVANESAP
jgi:nucleoside-diphosphate-sugar epimerase